jgi:hypothetical protein
MSYNFDPLQERSFLSITQLLYEKTCRLYMLHVSFDRGGLEHAPISDQIALLLQITRLAVSHKITISENEQAYILQQLTDLEQDFSCGVLKYSDLFYLLKHLLSHITSSNISLKILSQLMHLKQAILCYNCHQFPQDFKDAFQTLYQTTLDIITSNPTDLHLRTFSRALEKLPSPQENHHQFNKEFQVALGVFENRY